MGRRRASLSNRKEITPASTHRFGDPGRGAFSIALTPPACFVSALALSLMIGSGTAEAVCTPVTAGQVLTCANDTPNPAAFTATNDFTVTIVGDPNAADITRTSGNAAGLQINGGNFGGTIDMGAGATITTNAGGSGRHGLVVSSGAATTDKTYAIDLDGHIVPAAADGDALRLQGTAFSVFSVTLDENAVLGGSTGDDGIIVTGAKSMLLDNYGELSGGSGQPTTGGEGINVGNGSRIAAAGIVINNYNTITGTGNSGIAGGQGVSAFGLGDVTVANSEDGTITGATQGVRVDAAGAVTITNDGHIQGHSASGVEVVAGTTVNVTNTSTETIEGATNGLYIHDVDEADIDNDHGRIIGHDGEGVLVEEIAGDVSLENRFGWPGTDHAKITGSENGVAIGDIGGSVGIDNRFGGTIAGYGADGLHVEDVAGAVRVNNAFFGSILGHDDGVHIGETGGDVTINNSIGGDIQGYRGDGIAIHDGGGSVAINNAAQGEIRGRDDGIRISDVRDEISINNGFGGSVSGRRGDGIAIRDADDDVGVFNAFGGTIAGGDNGMNIRDADGDISVYNSFGGTIVGQDEDGLNISDVRRDVTIYNQIAGTIAGGDAGTRIRDVRGDVGIDNSEGRISGHRDSGVDVSDVRGDVGIRNWNGEIAGRDDGVRVEDVRDNVTIDNRFGGLIAGERGNGINLDEIGDNATVLNIAGTIRGDDDGIKISDVDDDVRIDNRFGGSITGHDGNGVSIDDVGDAAIVKNSMFGSIAGRDDGVHIRDVNDGVFVDNRFGGEIKGSRDDGIDIQDVDDSVGIDNRFGGKISGRDDGVAIHHVDGAVGIANSFGGDIRGRRGDGISVDHVEGSVAVSNEAHGSITGRDNGLAIHAVEGDVHVENGSSNIRGRHGDGVTITAEGTVTVENGRSGTIRGGDSAISIDAQSAEITSRGEIRGSDSDDPTIRVTTTSGATINNDRGGVIRGDEFAPTDLIVEGHGGAVTINNAGTMVGRIDLADAGNSQTGNVFNNSSNNSWRFTGTSQLGDGLDDVYNNTGTIYATDANAPEANDVTELAGVETFTNGSSGKAGTIDLQDGYTGDVFTLSATGGGALTFHGESGLSFLKVDSFLGTPASSSSDMLVIAGNVTGATGIDVNNVNDGFGGYNPNGIGVVSAEGSVTAANFFLIGGPIDTGLFTYDLYLNGANEWVLASTPNQTFFELPSLTSAAQSMWHDAAGVWLDRTADLRSSLIGGCEVSLKGSPETCVAKPTSGVWAKVLGAAETRSADHGTSLFGVAQKYAVEYRHDGAGVMGGYDFARPSEDGKGVWMAGVMAGYLASNLDFKHSATGADFESGTVGGYLTYLRGGWFFDSKVVASLGDVDYDGKSGVKDNADVISIGGVLDTGYRMNYGRTFIEPGATLAYVNTDIDDLSVYGASVNFSNGESLRGRLGLRFGTTIQNEQAKYEPFVGVSAWYEFLGDNGADVTSGSYVLKAADDVSGAIGEVSGGVNIFSVAGDDFSGFIKGNVAFGKDDFVGYGGTVGARVGW